ncbi:DUF6932 family protein [Vibrio vulnificus]|uniref:DUF6932 family protein n=1 Tax=Vibrio vulnificus TaxID=672 RepID=UPI00398137E6
MTLNYISVSALPWDVLTPGIHTMSLADFENEFVYNDVRRKQFKGLILALRSLQTAGCAKVYIDGSYVTKKPVPGDFDACWDRGGVNPLLLDSELLEFTPPRVSQKLKYEGELFLSDGSADGVHTFLDFFQKVRGSNDTKGIVELNLSNEDLSLF